MTYIRQRLPLQTQIAYTRESVTCSTRGSKASGRSAYALKGKFALLAGALNCAPTATPPRLTVESHAICFNNLSLSKLRHEFGKLRAPTPGDLIRETHIAYAAHLLVETRLLVREVAARAGYDSEKHFAEQFQRALGVTPSVYRRERIARTLQALPSQEDP
jgi:AraC-like DNA-binding protein